MDDSNLKNKIKMPENKENNLTMNDELSKANLSLYEESIEIWRIEEMCIVKIKSIKDIKKSIVKVITENELLKKQLDNMKSRIEEVRDNIVSIDNISIFLYETLANLELQRKKKEFSINKLRNNYELQLFIKMELWKKKEKQLNNLPEIKSLKIVESELENTKLEYEKLLIDRENLTNKIKRAKEDNNKKENGIIIEFADVYVKMLCLNEKEENYRNLLRKLEAEYNKKLNIKSSWLESQQKTVNKVLLWTHTFCPFDSITIDKKFDEIKTNLKPNFKYLNPKNITFKQKLDSKSENKSKINVTFPLCEDNVLNTNNDILNASETVNPKITRFSELTDSLFIKNNPTMNINKNLPSTNITKEQNKVQYDTQETQINNNKLDEQTNKRKIIKEQSDFEFKKPYNPEQDEINKKPNIVNSIVNQENTKNKDIHIKSNFNEIIEKDVRSNNSMNINYCYKDSDNKKNIQENKSFELYKENSFNPMIIDGLLQYNESSSSHEQNKVLSGFSWHNNGKQQFENSGSSSFYESDLAELFGNNFDDNENSDIQFNFMESMNSHQNVMSECKLQDFQVKDSQQFGNFKFQQFKNNMDNDPNTLTNETMSKTFINDDLPILPHFVSLDKLEFNFN